MCVFKKREKKKKLKENKPVARDFLFSNRMCVYDF